MLKLISPASVPDGSGSFTYQFPESIGRATLKAVYAVLVTTVVGDHDISLTIVSSGSDNKAVIGVPNPAVVDGVEILTFGVAGAYYLAASAAGNVHGIPMNAIEIVGGDLLIMAGLVNAGEGFSDIAIWVDIED